MKNSMCDFFLVKIYFILAKAYTIQHGNFRCNKTENHFVHTSAFTMLSINQRTTTTKQKLDPAEHVSCSKLLTQQVKMVLRTKSN
jgi:hypothetical protein